ncbi:AraC family transcriptional regulator [Bacillus sp. SJS]|uniref:AraC family transcriptional regulator n=1 Tax=Bacillus sp. SJS TaxID=1423321 RepID=UPI0004DD0454|nr:AraC family transcriptional regulator [Bacillus sp. SJS]KZZ84720.1 AraC family transcriptional regulator [Bacillus sp. SJS]
MNYGKEQERQIQKVMDYIEENLHESLPLERLAKVSTYSPFHFQRIFKGIAGESPAAYIKRLRLENAAHFLIYEQHLPITQIAYLCGFSSLSYFTYSFNETFRTSPKKWREGAYLERFPREYEDSKKSKLFSKNLQATNDKQPYNEFRWLDLDKVKTIELPAFRAVRKLHIGSYTDHIPNAWEELYHWSNARGLIQTDTWMIGIPRNNPYITLPERSRYDCLMQITSHDNIEEPLYTFNGGKHVVVEFDEPVLYSDRGMLIECYSELYSFWLPRSGYKYLGNPIEFVQVDPNGGTLDLTCRIKAIALAVEPK